MLRLFGEVTYNAQIRPICIIFDDVVNSGTIKNFKAFGIWQSSQALQAIDLIQKRFTDCQRIGKTWEANQICAGLLNRNSCAGISGGTSGGPLTGDFTYGGKRLTVQFGIVTSGRELCNWASVYTDVTAYKDWIYTVLRKAETKIDHILYEDCKTNWDQEVAVRPWEVSLIQNMFTGALISNQFVVTVASAILTIPNKIKVETKLGQSLDVKSIHIHPEFSYSPGTNRNNIALLKLAEKVPSSGVVKPICIVMNPKSPRTLTALINLNNEGFVGTHKVPLKPIHYSVCSQIIGMTVEYNQFCVEEPPEFNHPKSGSIVGTFQNISGINKYILVGLKSFHANGVFVYTYIHSYADWIMKAVHEN
ncbi:vitamin K-dependent protein C [Drosophila takahashii]|uniref:vitamin K-dependent protein C n=1 Tax=Drosophila takahashii TaxID=29030 RepID=UPI0038990C6C